MIRNPVLQEARAVYLHRREYLWLHVGYLAATTLMLLVVWPSRGLMHFFRTQSPPPVYDVMVVYHVITLCLLNIYIGQDRLADSSIIRYSEWLERTSVPIRLLVGGKLIAAALHTLVLTILILPFLVIAASPAGTSLPVVARATLVLLLVSLLCRIVGMLISHWGESNYVIRVVGAWVFIALLFVATIQSAPAINPVVAVVGAERTAVPITAYLTTTVAFIAVHVLSLTRHRRKAAADAD